MAGHGISVWYCVPRDISERVDRQPPDAVHVPLADATRRLETVRREGVRILTACDVGDRMPDELLGA
jgi:hypothetical protein